MLKLRDESLVPGSTNITAKAPSKMMLLLINPYCRFTLRMVLCEITNPTLNDSLDLPLP